MAGIIQQKNLTTGLMTRNLQIQVTYWAQAVPGTLTVATQTVSTHTVIVAQIHQSNIR